LRFFRGETPGIKGRHQRFVKDALKQKPGNLTTAAGEYDFEIAKGADLYAKTGFVELPDKQRTSWLVGQIERDGRVIVFVSSVYGTDPKIAGLSAARVARKRLGTLLNDAK
jgi:beta-lactamase class D